MNVLVAVVVVSVFLAAIADRHDINLSEMHAALGHRLGRKLAHGVSMAAQQCHFHAMAMIEPRAHGGDRQVMVLVLRLVEPHGKVASIVIIDIGHRSNAAMRGGAGIFRAHQRIAHQIAHRFRTVGIALFLSHLAQFGKSTSMLRSKYPNYYISKNKIELNKDINADKVLADIQEKYKKQPINTVDGVKIEFDKEWVHLRKSNTEPIIRIYAESKSQTTAENLAVKIIADIKEVIKK